MLWHDIEVSDLIVLTTIRGVGEGWMKPWATNAMRYWYAGRDVSGGRMVVLEQMALLPWGLRAMWPLLTRRVGLMQVLSSFGFFAMTLNPGLRSAAVCHMFDHVARVNYMVAHDAVLAKVAGDPTTTTWLLTPQNVGVALGLPIAGLCLELLPVEASFYVLAVLAMLMALVLSQFLKYDPIETNSFVPALYCSVAAVVLVLMSFHNTDPSIGFVVAVFSCVTGVFVTRQALGDDLMKVSLYIVLIRAFAPNVRTAQFYFYTDSVDVYPEGPHLDAFFYSTLLGYATNFFGIGALFVYARYLSRCQWRSIFTFTALLTFLSQLLSLPVYWRWFRELPLMDVSVIFVDEAVLDVVEHLIQVPWYLITSKFAKNNGIVLLALCGSLRYLADYVSTYSGALLLSVSGVDPDGTAQDASVLPYFWQIKFIRAVCAFLPAYFTVPFLIPAGSAAREPQEEEVELL